jgi:DNA-binding NarL/FixJ family response regulator
VIRVFLIAASPLARAALQNRFKGQGVKLVGSAAAVDVLSGDLSNTRADVLLVDAEGESPEALIESLTESGLAADIPIVVLIEAASAAASAQGLQAGIRAVLPREISTDQLAAALQAAAAGLVVLHSAEIPVAFPSGAPASQSLAELPEPLTRREREVLQMLAAGLANKEIAARLNISDHTAKFHVASILGKLGAASRAEAVSIGMRNGLILL